MTVIEMPVLEPVKPCMLNNNGAVHSKFLVKALAKHGAKTLDKLLINIYISI
jgi:hypothetical protein